MDKKDEQQEKEIADSAEFIQKYISELNLERGINSPDKYTISLAVSKDGIVDIQMDWPEILCEDMVENIAHLLYALNSSDMKPMIVESLAESSVKKPELDAPVKQVVSEWLKFQEKYQSEPCIRPRDALRDGV